MMLLQLVSALSVLFITVNGQTCSPSTELWSLSFRPVRVVNENVALSEGMDFISRVNLQTGAELWTRDGADVITLESDCLSMGRIVGVDGDGDLSYINARTGNTIWKVTVPPLGSPTRVFNLLCVPNANYVLVIYREGSFSRALTSYRRNDGLRLWEDSDQNDRQLSILTANTGLVIYRFGGKTVTRTSDGQVLSTIRRNPRSIVSGRRIYLFSANKIRRLTTTGEEIWSIPRLAFDGILSAKGLVYATRSGQIVARLTPATGRVIELNYPDGTSQLLANGQVAVISEDQSLTVLTRNGDTQFTIGPPPRGELSVEVVKNRGIFELYYFVGNLVRRLDLTTGSIIWEFQSDRIPAGSVCSPFPFCSAGTISLAKPLEGDSTRIFVRTIIWVRPQPQPQVGFVALNRETGLLAWDTGRLEFGIDLVGVSSGVAVLSLGPDTSSGICAV